MSKPKGVKPKGVKPKGVKPNWESRTLFQGDNLLFLRAMNTGTVDLIATDPPFNKGRDFHLTPESLKGGKIGFQDRWSWKKDVHQDWVDKLQNDWKYVYHVIQGSRESYGDSMGAFLCFMAVRLIEMRRVLKPTGSIYLHCDPTASHYLKELMDAIFGRNNFRNEIIWHYRKWSSGWQQFQRNHDVILFYSRSDDEDRVFTKQYMSRAASTQKRFGNKKIISGYDETGKRLPSQMEDEDSDGVPMDDVWDIGRVPPIKQLYPTQKPAELYKRIIKASSKKGDVVLDPFCGCATTLIAAECLGRDWVGIDIWEKSHKTVKKRIAKECILDECGKPRDDVLVSKGSIIHSTEPPNRTDDGGDAVPFLQVKVQIPEPNGPKMSTAEIRKHLLEQHGPKCQGCNRSFDDERYLEVDHNRPRKDGGWNHVSNRILLCGPCNKLKSSKFTLSGLRGENKRLGYMRD